MAAHAPAILDYSTQRQSHVGRAVIDTRGVRLRYSDIHASGNSPRRAGQITAKVNDVMPYPAYLRIDEYSTLWQNGCVPIAWLAMLRDAGSMDQPGGAFFGWETTPWEATDSIDRTINVLQKDEYLWSYFNILSLLLDEVQQVPTEETDYNRRIGVRGAGPGERGGCAGRRRRLPRRAAAVAPRRAAGGAQPPCASSRRA